jgi:hypothetical protein
MHNDELQYLYLVSNKNDVSGGECSAYGRDEKSIRYNVSRKPEGKRLDLTT